MADKFSYDVFLSHNAKDKPRVRKLAQQLKQAGLRVWFDEWNIKPGEIISLKVDEGLEQSRVLVLCISPNALESGWVALERSTAIHRDPSNAGRRFIPILLADTELPDTLRRYKYVDLRGQANAAFAELLAACQPDSIEAPDLNKPSSTSLSKRRPPLDETDSMAIFERTLTGHSGWISTVKFSSDGKWAVSGSADETIRIWDLTNWTCRSVLKYKGEVNSVVITPDDARILAGSGSSSGRAGEVIVWNAATGEREGTIQLKGKVMEVAVSDDGVFVFVAEALGEKSIQVFEIATRKLIRTYERHPGEVVRALATGGLDGRFVSGGSNGLLAVWEFSSERFLAEFKAHSGHVNSAAISRDGRIVVSGGDDGTVKIWDLVTLSLVATLEGHQGWATSVDIAPNNQLIASAGWKDNTVRLWDRASGECVFTLNLVKPENLSFSRDGRQLFITVSEKHEILVYRLKYAAALTTSDSTRRYVNAKVVLLGEGTVGKTSLAHRLIEDKYVVRDRTHGMNVWRLDLPLSPDAALEREALLWDLAGQEDYRLIHQLFLDETALALLLINPQKDDPFAEAGDWLKALKAAATLPGVAREAARLMIFSQIDVGGMKLSTAKIQRFLEQYGFNDWLATSAKTGENCSDEQNDGNPSKLKQLIADSIPWDKLPWTSTPRVLTELKNAVVAMRDERDIRLMRFSELAQRLEQALPDEKFGESDVRTAVTLLANHGLARPLKFGDLVLLQPELLNGYAGAIIRAARANKDEIGSVPEADIYRSDFDFTGVERLKHRPDEELLLRALVQTFLDHSLCIAEDLADGRHLVFPSQYRREKDIPRDPDVFVSYTFSGEWQTVWTTLVVRLWYSQEFDHKELWRNAAEFASPKGFTLGLKIDNKQGEGTATISLYFDKEVPDDLKAIFIEFVHRHLAKYGCEVSRDRRYVCQNCGNPVKDLEAVRKRVEAKKDFITCQECDERVVLIDFIEQRLKSDPVARKIMAMDETATRGLDTQALEQILMGHMMAICGEANQIFRPVTMSEQGIDAEVEFKDNDGKLSGKKILVQLRSWDYYNRALKSDGNEIFEFRDQQQLDSSINRPANVYLVIRQTDEALGSQVIRWMNITRYLKDRKDKTSRQIIFTGEKLDMEAVWKVRDQFFPPKAQIQK